VAGTHYDVLGVRPDATAEELRRAYLERARVLHPDTATAGLDEADAVRHAMQDLNEAWQVLRDPHRRAAYDESLRQQAQPADARSASAGHSDFDRPFARRPAEPGDLTVAVVRAAPWIAVLVVLAVIFVFTAFAKDDRGDHADIVGSCVTASGGRAVEVPCNQPNDGMVVSVVTRQSRCQEGLRAYAIVGGDWYCLRPTLPE
jgi:curved DNA-binding protein CbpA